MGVTSLMDLMSNPLAVLSYATIRQEHRTEAAVFSNVTRTMGSSLGIAALHASDFLLA